MSSSESEIQDDPFAGTHTDSDEDFLPSSANEDSENSAYLEENTENEHNLKVHKGKKRTRREKLWKRNIRKMKRVHGEEYFNTNNQTVSKKSMGDSCNCKNKCFEKVNMNVRSKIFEAFYNLDSKELQDSYLACRIQSSNIARKRPRNNDKPKSISCTFHVSIKYFKF